VDGLINARNPPAERLIGASALGHRFASQLGLDTADELLAIEWMKDQARTPRMGLQRKIALHPWRQEA